MRYPTAPRLLMCPPEQSGLLKQLTYTSKLWIRSQFYHGIDSQNVHVFSIKSNDFYSKIQRIHCDGVHIYVVHNHNGFCLTLFSICHQYFVKISISSLNPLTAPTDAFISLSISDILPTRFVVLSAEETTA